MRPSQDCVHIRHFYQLAVDGEIPERWYEYERGDGTIDPIRFELYWLPLRQVHVVGGGMAAMAARIVPEALR